MKKLLLCGHDEAAGEHEEGLSDVLRAENRELKMEIFSMQDELVELEKQVCESYISLLYLILLEYVA